MLRFPSLFAGLLPGLLLAAPLVAQNAPTRPASQVPSAPGRLIGSVVTSENGQPLAAAAITIRSAADSALVTGVLTSKEGRFIVEGMPLGGYTLRVSLLGYKPRTSEVVSLTAEKVSYDFGAIKLEVLPVQLQAVEAVGERQGIVVEADRTVYNTKSMPAAAGTATDVLRAVPELEVDVNNNVKLRGNQTVAIHLNGRPAPLRGEQLANFLQQLPGNRIDRVEVMPNPSAKHDPEGMGGIVNIVLKDNVDLGLSGSLSVNASTRNQQGLSGRLNYQRGRLTLFMGAYSNIYQSLSTNYDLRRNLVANPVTSIEQNGRSDYEGRGGGADWTAELKVGKQAHLWSNAWMYGSGSDNQGVTAYGILDDVSGVRERYDRVTDGDGFFGNIDVGLGFKQIFQQQKEELTIDGRISRGGGDNDSRVTKLFMTIDGTPANVPDELTLSDVENRSGNLSVRADYFRPFLKGRLDVGYNAWRRDQDDENLFRIFSAPDDVAPRTETISGFDFDETFHAFYTTVAQTFGKFGVQAGLRAELAGRHFASRVVDEEFETDYNSLFPSFNLSYNIKQGRTVRLLYSKRIGRPYPFYLNPFVPSTDPLNISVGNPDLKPTYTHSFSTDFSWTGTRGTVRIAPYFRKTINVWERIRTVDTAGVATNRWENAASSKNYGSSFTLSLRSSGKVSGSTNFSLYRDVRDGSNISSTLRRSAFMWSMGANLGVKITPTLTAQTYANYFPQQSILQGRATGYVYNMLGLRQQLWGTKGSISVNISDPLALQKYNSSTRDASFIQNSRSSYRSRQANLSFTYNFGKPPQQQSRRTADEAGGETIRVR